ncbi:hypothetical protein OUZ56_016992 [Daphnia magna]|uniref:Uncharacterized protein n=1 Tax=Daphnia magna TaxID=35525 RepID=A0ABR0ARX9_9CRUS|nr:hypothetical protein OUZ56_016992 [Daphnia magna]
MAKRVEHMKCKACGVKPLACHCDGNMKCYRSESAQSYGAKELLENMAIAKNDEVLWFGHFRKGAAVTVGEEMEQGFSKISRYNASTKPMTSSKTIT